MSRIPNTASGRIWLPQVREGAGRGRGARRGGGRQEAHPGDEDDGEAPVHQLRHLGQRQGQSYTVLVFFPSLKFPDSDLLVFLDPDLDA